VWQKSWKTTKECQRLLCSGWGSKSHSWSVCDKVTLKCADNGNNDRMNWSKFLWCYGVGSVYWSSSIQHILLKCLLFVELCIMFWNWYVFDKSNEVQRFRFEKKTNHESWPTMTGENRWRPVNG
jgi:hypothetical protein